jgi:hypothetical protein
MKTKTFDCVEMKRQGAAKIYEETRGMTVAEQVAYWKERTAELRKLQQAVRERHRLADGQTSTETETLARGRD